MKLRVSVSESVRKNKSQKLKKENSYSIKLTGELRGCGELQPFGYLVFLVCLVSRPIWPNDFWGLIIRALTLSSKGKCE